MEDEWPGLWRIWETRQVVTFGWPPIGGWSMEGGLKDKSWTRVRKALERIQPGDGIVARLPGHRIGRVGQVIAKAVTNEEFAPIVPISKEWPGGEQGRIVTVRWDFTKGPPIELGYVCKVPPKFQLGSGKLRGTISRLTLRELRHLEVALTEEANWAPASGARFAYEAALSDYIATFPEKLEAGLRPYPLAKNREQVTSGRDRLDVLLIDRNDSPVVVECKQDSASLSHLEQLRRYMGAMSKRLGRRTRGILVFGGSPNVSDEVLRASRRSPRVELFAYKLEVGFTRSIF